MTHYNPLTGRHGLEPKTRTDGDPQDWWPMRDQAPTKTTVRYVRKHMKDDEEAVRLLLYAFPDWRPWRGKD